MNVIIESPSPMRYFTDVGFVLSAAGVELENYVWFLSDVETNIDVPELYNGDCWLDGEAFSELLKTVQLQFIWGVISAVKKDASRHVDKAPFVIGNQSYWSNNEIRPQLASALFEVVCWDSSATILVGFTERQKTALNRIFPDIKPLVTSSLGRAL